MEKNYRVNDLTANHLEQELAVAKQMISSFPYEEPSEKVKLYLNEIDDDSFIDLGFINRYLRVAKILLRFKRLGILNYSLDNDEQRQAFKAKCFDLDCNEPELRNYVEIIKDEIEKRKKKGLDKKFVSFENDSLIMQLPDGSPAPIDFNTKRGNKDMLNVFEIIFEHWRTAKETEFRDGWWVVSITKGMIRVGLEKKGKKDLYPKFIINNISYIRNLKIKPSKLSGLVELSYHNRKIDGWVFRIKKP